MKLVAMIMSGLMVAAEAATNVTQTHFMAIVHDAAEWPQFMMLSTPQLNSKVECGTACTATEGCSAFVFQAGICYLGSRSQMLTNSTGSGLQAEVFIELSET